MTLTLRSLGLPSAVSSRIVRAVGNRVVPFVVALVVVGACAFALLRAPATSTERNAAASPLPAAPEPSAATQLPPGHPPIGNMAANGSPVSPHGSEGFGVTDEPAAIAWTAPSTWHVVPNPNALRIASYRVSTDPSDPTEVTVSRAGGSVEANIRRWIAQFDEAGADTETSRKVGGIDVTLVEVSGTYVGSGMPGSASVPQKGWTLVGAIAAGRGTPYFFKMIGPTPTVRAAHPAFDAMIGSLSRVSRP